MTDQPPFQSQPATLAPGAPPPAAPAARSGGLPWLNVALAVAIAVAIGGIGFAAGRLTAPAAALGPFGGQGRQVFPGGGPNASPGTFGGPGGGPQSFFGGAAIEGTVESSSGDTLTLKLANGSTIQVSLGDTTTYHSQAAASSSDVTAGSSVIVRIQPDPQGSNPGSLSAGDVTIVP